MTQYAFANPFFAYSFGFPDLNGTEQIEFLSEAGYDGIASDVWSEKQLVELQEIIATPQVQSGAFTVYGVYFPYDFRNAEHRNLVSRVLEIGHSLNIPLWLAIKSEDSSEAKAVALLQSVCDEAAEYGTQVIYYPHDRHLVLSAEASLPILKRTQRNNLSTSIQLNHELRAGNQHRLEEVIKASIDSTTLATISGAQVTDRYHTGSRDWSDVIQPLANSPFDVQSFVQLLRKHGYEGPIGLQNFKIEGDAIAHHQAAIKVWNSWNEQP